MIDRLVSGPAFYEALATVCRSVIPSADEILGKDGLEGAIREILKRHGLEVVHGKYESPEDLECDALVETPNSIILIEAKKKGLTRKSLAGDALSALLDFSGSLIAAHAQLARHERFLLEGGEMHFVSGKVVTLRGRRIERIAITLLDLGSLQDKVVMSNLLSSLRGASLQARPRNKAEERAIRAFNENAAVLLQAFEASASLIGNYDRAERFRMRSFSLSELMLLLDDVSGPLDIESNLSVDRHMTTATGDWFSEFQHMKTLRGASEPNVSGRPS